MKNRMSRCAALIGTVLSLSGFAQVCNDVSLYKNGEAGKMENKSFPEAPEWIANGFQGACDAEEQVRYMACRRFRQ